MSLSAIKWQPPAGGGVPRFAHPRRGPSTSFCLVLARGRFERPTLRRRLIERHKAGAKGCSYLLVDLCALSMVRIRKRLPALVLEHVVLSANIAHLMMCRDRGAQSISVKILVSPGLFFAVRDQVNGLYQSCSFLCRPPWLS